MGATSYCLRKHNCKDYGFAIGEASSHKVCQETRQGGLWSPSCRTRSIRVQYKIWMAVGADDISERIFDY